MSDYVKRVQMQEYIYPSNYVKLRCLENHDQERIASLVKSMEQLKLWTTFVYLQKGATMIYAGQEALCTHTPSLFDVDKVDWSRYNEAGVADLMVRLAELKKDDVMNGFYQLELGDVFDTVYLAYETCEEKRVAIFNFGLKSGEISVNVPDGEYEDLMTHELIAVYNGKIRLSAEPIIFDLKK